MKLRPLVFMSIGDPRDVSIFSGSTHHLWNALRSRYPEAQFDAAPVPRWFTLLQRVLRRVPGVRLDIGGYQPIMRRFARALLRRLPGDAVVISLNNSPVMAEVAGRLPTIYVSDATYAGLVDLYEFRSRTGPAERSWFHESERLAITRARAASFSSPWAARSAIEDYGADPARVSVTPWGCNFDYIERPGTVVARSAPCRLLLPGREWHRKGADLAIETVDALQGRGIDAVLHIAGMTPPADYRERGDVVIHGMLRKSVPEEAERLLELFRTSHFLLLPTRADCTPMVFAEANAFGAPAVTLDVGGVTGVVEHGVNGLVGAKEDGPEGLARLIAELWADPAAYARLRVSSRRIYEERLNWTSWVEAVAPTIDRLRADAPEPFVAA